MMASENSEAARERGLKGPGLTGPLGKEDLHDLEWLPRIEE